MKPILIQMQRLNQLNLQHSIMMLMSAGTKQNKSLLENGKTKDIK